MLLPLFNSVSIGYAHSFLSSVQMTRSSLLVACVTGVLCIVHRTAAAYENSRQHVIEESARELQSPIHDALATSSIIPDVLDDFSPTYSLLITYPSTHSSVTLGNTLSTSSVKSPPVYQFTPLFPSPPPGPEPPSKNRSFTIILTDPDAKSRSNPIWSEFCHWVVANVSSPELLRQSSSRASNNNGEQDPHHDSCLGRMEQESSSWALGSRDASEPDVLESYYAPSPPEGSGFHRYVFVLLEGDARESWRLSPPVKRKHWGYGKSRHGVRDWAAEHELKVVGANFFYSQNDADDT